MSTAGINAAVSTAVDDIIEEMDAEGTWAASVDSPELRAMLGAMVRAVLERLEAQATAGSDPVQINE